jgi:hypothetical protein
MLEEYHSGLSFLRFKLHYNSYQYKRFRLLAIESLTDVVKYLFICTHFYETVKILLEKVV